MLSALTGIQSDTIVDYTITKHFNERSCIEQLISSLTIKDTVILDRGYFSKEIFTLFFDKKVNCVMRIKKDANIIAKQFFKSKKRNLVSNIICNGKIIPIRYIKYTIDESVFMIATSLFHKSINQIKNIYKQRWRVELNFKRLKSYLHLKKIYAKTESLWKQEVQLRILLDTLTRTKQLLLTKLNEKNKNKITYKYLLNKTISLLFQNTKKHLFDTIFILCHSIT